MPFYISYMQNIICVTKEEISKKHGCFNFLRVHSTPLSVLLTKVLNSAGPITNPWGMLLFTDLHMDIESLTATQVQLSNQFAMQSGHLYVKSVCLQFQNIYSFKKRKYFLISQITFQMRDILGRWVWSW